MTTSIFNVSKWEESFTFEEKLAHATVQYDIKGDLTGTIQGEYSIVYLSYNHEDVHQSSSIYEGFLVFEGEINGKSGSFLLKDTGSFGNQTYEAKVEIIPGSGTKELSGIKGMGRYIPTEDGMELELELS